MSTRIALKNSNANTRFPGRKEGSQPNETQNRSSDHVKQWIQVIDGGVSYN
jgi:hypothetical protein